MRFSIIFFTLLIVSTQAYCSESRERKRTVPRVSIALVDSDDEVDLDGEEEKTTLKALEKRILALEQQNQILFSLLQVKFTATAEGNQHQSKTLTRILQGLKALEEGLTF